MRTIKFRAWIDGVMQGHFDFDEIAYEGNGWTTDALKKMIWMQYTGLLDKNGKEIYEGDIYKYNGGHLEKVEWIIAKNGISGFKLWSNAGLVYEDIEVIGNVWENPELLENKVTI